jgi:MFS family permease
LTAGTASVEQPKKATFGNTLWSRQLSHYPNTGPRSFYLGITVVATIILYYEFYLQGAVATKIITDEKLHMSFTFFVVISIIANGIGAFSSLVAGLADRWGRANLVTYGLFVTGAIYAFALPHAPSKIWYTVIYAFVGFVEGIMLVATPALIRDFSPQVGRGFAMGFWTLGPVLGSLVVTEVSSQTLDSHPNWRFQFYVCGAVGLAVAVIAFIGLRELSPRLRDQLMVTLRDRALIEARAAGLKIEDLSKNLWKQMLKLNIIGPAFAISLFLLLYYIAAGFAVVYFATVYGYSEPRANGLANWYWITNAIALILTGILSDYFRVRKPFMIVGTLISLVGIALFAIAATDPSTSYYHLAVLFIIIAGGGGITYCAWMAAFTETVEKRNPAATATGLAVWGWIIRIVVTVALLVLTFVVSSTSTLVDTQSKYPQQVGVLSSLDDSTAAALGKNPSDTAALSVALGAVAKQQATLAKDKNAGAIGAQVSALVTKHATPLKTLLALDDKTAAALTKNSTDPAALPTALKEVALSQGASPTLAGQVEAITKARSAELGTASAIDPTTLATLQKTPTDATAIAKAQGEIADAFKITPAAALTRLIGLSSAAVQKDLAVVTPYATALQTASAAIPAADLALINKYGTVLKSAQAGVPADVLAKLQKAKHDTPKQWQRWWWICFAAQIVFLPFVFLLTGRWSARKARKDEQDHEEMIEREMESLGLHR